VLTTARLARTQVAHRDRDFLLAELVMREKLGITA
jgi:hypothetical protein